MDNLTLQRKTVSLIDKNGKEINLVQYFVIINEIEVVLRPSDYTCKNILESYFNKK